MDVGYNRATQGGDRRVAAFVRDGRIKHLRKGGMILGPNPDAKYERGFVSFRRGSHLVLYTDGITEAARPGTDDLYGAARLGALCKKLSGKTAREIGEAVFDAAHDWSKGAPLQDDRTVVVLRRP